MDEAMGNFSLTLIDTLDTLAIMGHIQEFSQALRRVIQQVSFNANLSVSVFETNIRVLGGLLSGHVLAVRLKERGHEEVFWYQGELLQMGTEVAQRLMPAFDSETGIPYPRVNLRTGQVVEAGNKGAGAHSTCTACAGTLLLEFGALSRLTGNPFWEETARRVMDSIWTRRDRHTQLVGSVIDVQSGKWLRTDSGVGAGLDSYFEYLLKGYILFGEQEYWERFKSHYLGIDKYVRRGIHLVQVNMDNPARPIRSYADSLTAFWPGLQVLAGDLLGAKAVYEGFVQVVDKWEVLPEAYNFDLGVHWRQHHLRPEFIESTLFLYQATRSPRYLDIGRRALEVLERHARVDCGLAAFEDVKSKKLADRLDSFVLAETLKYLYLLFSEESQLPFNLDEFIFTTEAHLLPLSLSSVRKGARVSEETCDYQLGSLSYYRHLCRQLVAAESVKVVQKCGVGEEEVKEEEVSPLLTPQELDLTSEEHRKQLGRMGISIQQQKGGTIQLVHTPGQAETQQLGGAGLFLMKELIKLAEASREGGANPNVNFKSVIFNLGTESEFACLAGAAMFGRSLPVGSWVQGVLVLASPLNACVELDIPPVSGGILLVERGGCLFQEKALSAQNAGAGAAIIFDYAQESESKLISMSGEPGEMMEQIKIPSVFVTSREGRKLRRMLEEGQEVTVKILGEALIDQLDVKKQERGETSPLP